VAKKQRRLGGRRLLGPVRLGHLRGRFRRRRLCLRVRGELHDADVVAERVAQPAVDAVEALGRLVGELDALGLELLVGLAQIVGPQAGTLWQLTSDDGTVQVGDGPFNPAGAATTKTLPGGPATAAVPTR